MLYIIKTDKDSSNTCRQLYNICICRYVPIFAFVFQSSMPQVFGYSNLYLLCQSRVGIETQGCSNEPQCAGVDCVAPWSNMCLAWQTVIRKGFCIYIYIHPHNMPELGDSPIWDVDSANFSCVCVRGF